MLVAISKTLGKRSNKLKSGLLNPKLYDSVGDTASFHCHIFTFFYLERQSEEKGQYSCQSVMFLIKQMGCKQLISIESHLIEFGLAVGGGGTWEEIIHSKETEENAQRKIYYFIYLHILFKEGLKTYSGIELIRRFKIFLEDAVSYLYKVNITMFIQIGIQRQFRIPGGKHLYTKHKRG